MAEVQVFADIDALSQAAAARLITIAAAAIATDGRFILALSGGSTPQPLYRLLSQPPYRSQVHWQQTHLFWGDERLVPPDHPDSSYYQAHQILLRHLPLPANQVHRVQGEAAPQTAVAHYTQELQQVAPAGYAWPRFHLVLLGMGHDGHIASLFPGPIPPAEQKKPVMSVTADYDGRPAHRLTLTPLVFNDAHHILFLAAGAAKANALQAVLEGLDTPQKWPAQRIQPHTGTVTWLVDAPAAQNLSTPPPTLNL